MTHSEKLFLRTIIFLTQNCLYLYFHHAFNLSTITLNLHNMFMSLCLSFYLDYGSFEVRSIHLSKSNMQKLVTWQLLILQNTVFCGLHSILFCNACHL